jgi:hypothetical protein
MLGLVASVTADHSIECEAQSPWQVPAAYRQPATYYYSPTSQYAAAWTAAVSPSPSIQQAGCCNLPCCPPCCCLNQNDTNNSPPSNNTPEPPPPVNPPENENSEDNGGADNNSPGDDDAAAVHRRADYALQRVNLSSSHPTTQHSISGLWHSRFGKVNLRRAGSAVDGTVDYNRGGVIDVHGRYGLGILTLTYQHRTVPAIRGKVVFHYDSSAARFVGKARNAVSGRESDWSLAKK